MTGTLLGGRYTLGPLLGRGGMAEVRRARDIRLERDVAVKRLRPDLAGDAVFQARFRREAQAAAGLNHENIVSVYDTGEEFDVQAGIEIPYIVMELVLGYTLRDILHDGRKIQPERALEMVKSVLDALDYSHRHGIVHRDIKPANIMVTASGKVKVMDFGIARAVSDTAASMTQTAAVIGTPQYLSPEQIRGETVDRRSDIYATGCLLYELLVGRPPFQGDTPVALAYQHVREAPVTPSQLDPVITPEMDAIVLKALAKDPVQRYQTAKEMADDIVLLLAGQQVTAVIPPAPFDPAEAQTQLLTSTGVTTLGGGVVAARALPLEGDEEEESGPSKRSLIILLSSLGVVLLAVIIFIVTFTIGGGEPPPPETKAVPYVINLTQEMAEKQIRDAGLVPEVVHDNGPKDATVGHVTSQDPKANEQVELNTIVKLTVNDGPKAGTIPTGLKGLTQADAKKLLQDQGYTKIEVLPAPLDKYPYRDSYVPDHIIDVIPSEGTSATVDTKITLYYDSGKGKVENLKGLTQVAAGQTLTRAGFLNVKSLPTESVSDAEGTIVDQDPAAGSEVLRTNEITIWYAVKPTPPTQNTPAPTETDPSPTASPT